MKKIESLVFKIFLIIGIIMVIVGATIFVWFINVKNNSIETKAVITDVDRYYSSSGGNRRAAIYIQYFVEGKEYNTVVHYYVSGMQRDDEITVYCDKNNPKKVYTNGIIIAPSIISLLGIVFFLVGLIPIVLIGKKKKLRANLIESGRKIYADISEIAVNWTYSANRRHPFNIICQWNDTSSGIVYLFKSNNIWFDPENIIEEQNIKQLPVYIDENDYKKYYVEIDGILDKVQDLT